MRSVRVFGDDGWRYRECVWRKRGLAINRHYTVRGRWTLTHLATGYTIAPYFQGIATAERHRLIAVGEVLAACGDWDAVPENADEVAKDVRATVRCVAAMFGFRAPEPEAP